MPRWQSTPYRLEGDKLFLPLPDYRGVLAAGSTVGTPATEAVYAANFSDVVGGEVQWWKDPFGMVYVHGLVKRAAGIAAGQTILTLPPYCKSLRVNAWACGNNDAAGNITVVKVQGSGLFVNGFTNAAAAEARIYLAVQWRADQDVNA